VGLGGEKVRIGDDRHVVINGQRLDTTTPGFADVYSFDPTKHPVSSSYSGHVNGIGFAEGSWFSTHEAEYELLHSRDASAAQQLSAIAEEKVKVWRGFTNAAWAPTDGSQNGRWAQQKSRLEAMTQSTSNFRNSQDEVTVRPGHVFCLGDNTMNSSDSRMWPVPDFPQERIVGKSGWVFWPLSRRWGWSQH